MHSGMIAVGQRKHQEFCFMVKPSPGSRKLDLVPYSQIPDIKEMVFVSNNHVLIVFKTGAGIHFDSNGDVLHQIDRQGIYEDFKPSYYPIEITGLSEIVDGCRYMSYQTSGNTDYHNVIHYNEVGIATKVAHTHSTEYFTRERIRQTWKW